jgi:hypothetical protein
MVSSASYYQPLTTGGYSYFPTQGLQIQDLDNGLQQSAFAAVQTLGVVAMPGGTMTVQQEVEAEQSQDLSSEGNGDDSAERDGSREDEDEGEESDDEVQVREAPIFAPGALAAMAAAEKDKEDAEEEAKSKERRDSSDFFAALTSAAAAAAQAEN